MSGCNSCSFHLNFKPVYVTLRRSTLNDFQLPEMNVVHEFIFLVYQYLPEFTFVSFFISGDSVVHIVIIFYLQIVISKLFYSRPIY